MSAASFKSKSKRFMMGVTVDTALPHSCPPPKPASRPRRKRSLRGGKVPTARPHTCTGSPAAGRLGMSVGRFLKTQQPDHTMSEEPESPTATIKSASVSSEPSQSIRPKSALVTPSSCQYQHGLDKSERTVSMSNLIRSMGIQQKHDTPAKCAGQVCNHCVTSSKQLAKRPFSSVVRNNRKPPERIKCRFNSKCSVVVSKQRFVSKKQAAEHTADSGVVGYCSKYYGNCSCNECVVPPHKVRPATAGELRQLFVN